MEYQRLSHYNRPIKAPEIKCATHNLRFLHYFPNHFESKSCLLHLAIIE